MADLGAGFELSDLNRGQKLVRTHMSLTEHLVFDQPELKERYRRSGIEAVLFIYAIRSPDQPLRRTLRRRASPASWGDDVHATGLIVEASFHDPGSDGDAFDRWLRQKVLDELKGYDKLHH